VNGWRIATINKRIDLEPILAEDERSGKNSATQTQRHKKRNTKVERFRVQRSGFEKSRQARINGIVSLSGYKSVSLIRGMTNIQGFD
jgi:hypothetical protein